MKTVTISVADDLYQRASEKAAAAETSLPQVVQILLSEWAQGLGPVQLGSEAYSRTEFEKFLDDLTARPLKPGPSVGPLRREELYQRGLPGY